MGVVLVCACVCVRVRVDDRTDLSTVIGLLQISFLRAEERKCQERDQQGSCLLKNLDAISLSMPCARCECVCLFLRARCMCYQYLIYYRVPNLQLRLPFLLLSALSALSQCI